MNESDNKQVQSVAKRRPPAAGMGRVKGSKNKATAAIKEMIEGALRDAGGQDYLVQQAIENPSAFLALIGKILPKNIEATIDGNLTVTKIVREIVNANDQDPASL